MNMKTATRHTVIHPGEHLAEFLDEYGVTPRRLARDIHVSATGIENILAGIQSVTPDTALRLGRYFGTSGEFWMNLQVNYEMELAKQDGLAEIEHDVAPLTAGQAGP